MARGRDVILIVDDEPEIRGLLLDCLEVRGYTVFAAGDAAQALRVLAVHPEITLLLTDIVMPGGMNGFDLGSAATRMRPRLKVIYMSGYVAAEMTAAAMAATPVFLQKPFRFEHVLESIVSALAPGAGASPS
jgi:DNA-binding NtrC family response regulator